MFCSNAFSQQEIDLHDKADSHLQYLAKEIMTLQDDKGKFGEVFLAPDYTLMNKYIDNSGLALYSLIQTYKALRHNCGEVRKALAASILRGHQYCKKLAKESMNVRTQVYILMALIEMRICLDSNRWAFGKSTDGRKLSNNPERIDLDINSLLKRLFSAYSSGPGANLGRDKNKVQSIWQYPMHPMNPTDVYFICKAAAMYQATTLLKRRRAHPLGKDTREKMDAAIVDISKFIILGQKREKTSSQRLGWSNIYKVSRNRMKSSGQLEIGISYVSVACLIHCRDYLMRAKDTKAHHDISVSIDSGYRWILKNKSSLRNQISPARIIDLIHEDLKTISSKKAEDRPLKALIESIEKNNEGKQEQQEERVLELCFSAISLSNALIRDRRK